MWPRRTCSRPAAHGFCERFAPSRQVAFVAGKDVPTEEWLYLCPKCRRKLLSKNLTWAEVGKAE